tara:strand:- start:205 stop:570 length:366 start_codon:yes stop_codon:yes gene_type:complete
MSEILKVLNKQRVELKSERFDLSLVTQIRSKAKEAQGNWVESVKVLAKIMPLIDSAISLAAKAVKTAETQTKDSEKLDKMAKELGISLDADVKKAQQTIYGLTESYGVQHLKDLKKMKASI